VERRVTVESLVGPRRRELSFQIPAKAGTTIHALSGFRFGKMRGFQNGLLRSREANPEPSEARQTNELSPKGNEVPQLRTQNSCRDVIQESSTIHSLVGMPCMNFSEEDKRHCP
jgi:hypothetical protein